MCTGDTIGPGLVSTMNHFLYNLQSKEKFPQLHEKSLFVMSV